MTLGWVFTSEPQNADIEETSKLVRQFEKMAKGSADEPRVLGRESANLIELEGVANGSVDDPTFFVESRLISSGWMDWPKVALTYPAF